MKPVYHFHARDVRARYIDGRYVSAYDINFARSPLFKELDGRYPPSSSGAWSLPAKLGDVTFTSGIHLTHTKRWPDVVGCVRSFNWFVSARCAAIFREFAANDVEIYPIAVATSVKLRPAPPYFLMNIHRVVDCINLTVSRLAVGSDHPDLDCLWFDESEGRKPTMLDPERIPDSVGCFTTKYFSSIYVTGPLAKALLATSPKCADLTPIQLKRETPAQRTAALARIRREYDEAMKKKPPPAPKVAISELAIPEVVAAFFASDVRRDFRNVEVFDADGCSSAMGSLLAWKDLRWPKGHVPVADDGRGGYFAIDTTRTKEGDCPVVYFDHELADVDKKSGAITPNFEACDDTFAAWLKRVKNGSTGLPRRKR